MHSPPGHKVREFSPFLDGLITRNPSWLGGLIADGRLDHTSPPEAETLRVAINESGLDIGLRQFRNLEMLRITWRELAGSAPLEETMSDLSRLAEICLQEATDHHYGLLQEKFGTPRDRDGNAQALVILSMGKLGGVELNLSSDIDIVFCFPETGACDGRRKLSNEQFFTRLARLIINSLSEITEHGFVFRVDTRLRPFGESGPLVCSFGAMEQYYQREGRDWERYALVKARPVAGDISAGETLLRSLNPFVYRRYIDFGAVEILHEMYRSLREDSARNDRAGDIKRGPGGIREIEFMVQTYQLLRGGREHSLQTSSFLGALNALQSLAVLPLDVISELEKNYRFLRRLENCIQALHDQQTHSLPDGKDLDRVTQAMGFKARDLLLEEAKRIRESVSSHVGLCFPEVNPEQKTPATQEQWLSIRNHGSAGALAPDSPLGKFTESLARLSLSNRASRRLDAFMPELLERLESGDFNDEVVADVFSLVLAICRRSAYLALLVQNPPALDRMLSLFATSDWVAAVVIRYPALLDELIDPNLGKILPNREEMHQTAGHAMSGRQDTEHSLQALNHMKLSFSLRIAVAELESTLSTKQVQMALTDLAGAMIESCYQLARTSIREKHGEIAGSDLAVIGYGSMGANELGYQSDLDLVFLYRQSEGLSDGARPVGAEQYFTAMVRRLLSFLTSTTTSGRLYEVDTRLRPNGRSGLLVSSISAFERYQKNDAWVWELQALTRARPCAGNAKIGEEFSRLQKDILTTERDASDTRQQVRKMRDRLRKAQKDGDIFKHSEGGLIDVDFIAQLGVLTNAHTHQSLASANGTLEQLAALAKAGWLEEEQCQTLSEVVTALTLYRHMSVLSRQSTYDLGGCRKASELFRLLVEEKGG
jgi:glutamate-ammonia-ligase adenylyltransferase